MPNFENSRKRLNDLMSQRAQLLQAAETAQTGGDTDGFQAKMTEIRDLNARIDDVKAMVDEADRYAKTNAPVAGRDVTDAAELGRELLAGRPITFAPQDAARLLRRERRDPAELHHPDPCRRRQRDPQRIYRTDLHADGSGVCAESGGAWLL